MFRLNRFFYVGFLLFVSCATRFEHKGCYIESFNLADVKENVDTKSTIENRYGKPSITSIFNKNLERWYYTQRVIAESPAGGKKSLSHRSVAITFNKNGIVVAKDLIVGEKDVKPNSVVTKETAYKTTFLKETFRNIGKFSQSGGVLK